MEAVNVCDDNNDGGGNNNNENIPPFSVNQTTPFLEKAPPAKKTFRRRQSSNSQFCIPLSLLCPPKIASAGIKLGREFPHSHCLKAGTHVHDAHSFPHALTQSLSFSQRPAFLASVVDNKPAIN
uniref:Uncharacterized protein n=1 Tax=Salix viminalis TaxID=40686 RepID=A0A6N2MEK8_SALVM